MKSILNAPFRLLYNIHKFRVGFHGIKRYDVQLEIVHDLLLQV